MNEDWRGDQSIRAASDLGCQGRRRGWTLDDYRIRAARGMTAAEAAREMLVSVDTARQAARRGVFSWKDEA